MDWRWEEREEAEAAEVFRLLLLVPVFRERLPLGLTEYSCASVRESRFDPSPIAVWTMLSV